MKYEDLLNLIETRGVVEAAERIRKPYVPGIQDGENWLGWGCRTVAGAVLFYQTDADGRIDGRPRVLCVNAPEKDRASWDALAAQTDAPVTVLMTPGMVLRNEPQHT